MNAIWDMLGFLDWQVYALIAAVLVLLVVVVAVLDRG